MAELESIIEQKLIRSVGLRRVPVDIPARFEDGG